MMRLFLFSLCVAQSLAALNLKKLSYVRLPYRNAANAQASDYAMFQDAAHKAAYHVKDRVLYVTSGNGANKYLHMFDMLQPSNPTILYSHLFDSRPEDGQITDVAVCTDTIAVTFSNSIVTQEGHVELFNPFNRITQELKSTGRFTVGSYPKDMAFSSDCTRLVVVNEGPAGLDSANNFVDPEGSLNVIVRNDQGFPIDVPMNFMQFNDRYEEYFAKGVRYVYRGNHSANANIVNTFSQDLEPEAVTISSDDRYAFISLMENNAMAKVDLINLRIVDIYPLGAKNWTSYDIDACDTNKAYFPGRYNVYSFYQPGALAFGVVSGIGYVISADTGSPKTLTAATNGVDFSDRVRCRDARNSGMIDSTAVSSDLYTALGDDQALDIMLSYDTDGHLNTSLYDKREDFDFSINNFPFMDSNIPASPAYVMPEQVGSSAGGLLFAVDIRLPLGRAYMSTLEKNCVHGLIDDVHLFGGRGFSLWDSTTLNHVFESGEDLEKRAADAYPSTFNGECSSTRSTPTQQVDLRSDDMGPEPNSLAVGTISTEPVLFVGTRVGLVYTYAMRGVSATFQSVYREGQTSTTWGDLYTADNAGNAIISDIGFISANDSTTATPLVYVISRGSGSVAIYEVEGTVL